MITLKKADLQRCGACIDPWTDKALAAANGARLGATLRSDQVELDERKLRREKPEWYNFAIMKGLIPKTEKFHDRAKRLAAKFKAP